METHASPSAPHHYQDQANPSYTALKPFRRDDAGNFWTSNQIRNTATFAYTYPELQGLTDSDTLVRRVNMLYSPKGSTDATHFDPIVRRTKSSAAIAFASGYQYTLSISVQQTSLSGSPTLYVFLGGTKENSTDAGWIQPPEFVGKTSFMRPNTNMHTNETRPTVQSEIPLTAALEEKVDRGELTGMDETAVKAYLEKHLKWKIAKVCIDFSLPKSSGG
jgi:tyrosinase